MTKMLLTRRISLQVLAAASCGIALLACGGQSPRPLSLAITDWPGYEYFYLASKKNLDLKSNLRLKVHQFSSLEDQRRAFVRGDVEAIATTLSESIAICRQSVSRCPVIVLVLDESDGADQLIASSDFSSVAQLKGKRIGLERSDLGEYMAFRALQAADISFNQVKLVYAGPRKLIDLLGQNGVDAIVSYPPHIDFLKDPKKWKVLFSSSDIPGEIVDVLAVSPALFRDQSVVQRLVDVWWSARELWQQDPAGSSAVMAKRQGITAEQFQAAQKWIAYPSRADQQSLLAANGGVESTLQKIKLQLEQTGLHGSEVILPRVADPDRL